MHPTRSTVILGVALAASLAVNAIALWPTEKPAARRGPPPSRAVEAPKAKPSASPAEELRKCEDRLKARQAKDALRSLAEALRVSRDGASGKARGKDDLDDLRCRIAEQQMRDRWREKKKETLADVRKSLSNAEEQERNAASEARRFADSLDSSAADRERLAERYRPVRIARMAEIAAAIGAEPVDYGAATEAVKGLWVDEDRLIGEIYGAAAAERFAADADEGRLTVLSIISAMSGGPLPDSVF
ncbi:MAG: hypothetical protein M0R80_14855 [Proteobacteria bacterium]|jgi:hypothetical protein|nr:hypothetical protein [Pseudomonadota bacterium]